MAKRIVARDIQEGHPLDMVSSPAVSVEFIIEMMDD